MGHARGGANRRDGEADRHLRRRCASIAWRSPIDAVEIYIGPPRHGNGDRLPDLVADADRGTGTIVCNVQRYNPTPAQLAAVPAIQGRTKTTVNGTVPLLSPIGLDDTISECVPFNIMGHGQITPAAADYITTPKWGIGVVEQDFAELLVRGELTDGWGAGALSLATGLTYREQSFHDGAYPVEIDELGPPFNAAEPRHSRHRHDVVRRAARTCISSRRCRPSRAATTSGRRSASSTCRIWQSSSGEQRFGTSFAYRSSDYSSVGRFDSWKVGLDFQIIPRSALARNAVARRARSDVQRAVRQLADGRDACSIPPATGCSRPSRDERRQSRSDARSRPTRRSTASSISRAGPRTCACRSTATRSTSPTRSRRSARSVSSTSATSSGVLCEYVFRDDLGVLSRVWSPYLNLDLRPRAWARTSRSPMRSDVDLFDEPRRVALDSLARRQARRALEHGRRRRAGASSRARAARAPPPPISRRT